MKRIINLRTIDLNIFPTDKTIFGILGDEKTRYKNIKTEIESWEVRFSSVKLGVVFIMATPQTTYDGYLTQFNKYNLESNYIKSANSDALTKIIPDLFKVNETDNELTKLLKEIANDEEQKALLEASFEDTSGGVLWIVFLLETFKNFYLNYLPTYINEKLTYDPVITLAEVKEKLKPVLSDTFATLYSSFVKVEQESDLEQLKTDTNSNLEKAKKVIYDARDTKKPVEPEKPVENVEELKTKITSLEKSLVEKDNLIKEYDAYIDAVLEKQSQQPVYILTEEPEEIKPKSEELEEESDRISQ